MKVAIDPPVRRPLTPNEQRVYKLLQEGLEPLEIARKLHMALQISNLANRHDVPPDTVMGLITSIREKDWDIPKINKEEDNMSRGQKTPVEKVHEISVLKGEGKTHQQIAEITGVPISTVGKVCTRLNKAETKKEPAPSENGTSTKEIIPTTIVPEIPADVNPCDEVSDENFCCEVTGDTDMEAYMADREKFFAERKSVPDIVLKACQEMKNELGRKIAGFQAEITLLEIAKGEYEDELAELMKFLEKVATCEEGQK